mmetsp:Transcript_20744/g.55584  ORF Transcript_20744/g.55584 Transcript_20744/m.55584 type:complete len:133 (-) Transcript_20744:1538-1936(-)
MTHVTSGVKCRCAYEKDKLPRRGAERRSNGCGAQRGHYCGPGDISPPPRVALLDFWLWEWDWRPSVIAMVRWKPPHLTAVWEPGFAMCEALPKKRGSCGTSVRSKPERRSIGSLWTFGLLACLALFAILSTF